MTKFNSGKASVLVLTAVLAVASFLLGKSSTTISGQVPVSCTAGQLLLNNTCYDPGTNGKFDWCHCGTDHCNSINVPLASLLNAGHVSAQGNVLHEGDGIGQCDQEPEEPIYGCTDPQATNYSSEATHDNDTCLYASPEPSASPEPTATPSNGDLCANIDGIQTTMPEGLHQNANNCISYSEASAPPPSGGPQGQVLGATTMATAGSFAENLYLAIMALGGTLSAFGIKNVKKAFQKAK